MRILSKASLPVVRLSLTVQTKTPLQLPAYAGSALRGAFGHALLRMMPLPHHPGQACALQTTCPYCQVFAPLPETTHRLQKFSQMPAPYVIEPPIPGPGQSWGPLTLRSGDQFEFSLVLMGKALHHLHAVLLAWQQALQTGLGTPPMPCHLVAVRQEGEPAPFWHAGQGHLPSNVLSLLSGTTSVPPPPLGQSVTLHLRTPLRLQYQNQPARQHQLRAYTLLLALARRYQLLQDVYWGSEAPQQDFDALKPVAEAIALDASALNWFDWERYSSRQQQSMKLGGLVGTLHLQGDLEPFVHLLHLGQWLHVGKETTFGLGGYHLAAATQRQAIASTLKTIL